MNDSQLRNAVKRELSSRFRNNSNILILEEVGIKHGVARIDLLIVNNILHGYELKSDQDTLDRLPDQMQVFNSVLDRMTLVVGYRHAFKALKMIPEWWGVKLANMGPKGGVRFSSARMPRNNPSVDRQAVAGLLWRDEAIQLLDEIGGAVDYRRKPRKAIYARIAKIADINTIRSRVCRQLIMRKGQSSGALHKLCGD